VQLALTDNRTVVMLVTHLERLQKTGIKRLGKKDRFRFVAANGDKLKRDDLERIRALAIPPAWTEVAINPAAGGMLQVIGKDDAGRWQYVYHERHVRKREQRKFKRLMKFCEAMPEMRKVVTHNLRKRDLSRERVMACILRILSTCFLRAGSQVYANENGSYGLATLRPKHVNIRGDLVEFKFPGKGQIVHQREIRDRAVAQIIRSLLRHRARAVFKYQNGDGLFVNIRRRDINLYIKEIMGERFTSKDFRTWAATLICGCALARIGVEHREPAASRKRKAVKAVKETAGIIGNTPAVCRSSYICPEVIKSFEKGRVIDQYVESPEALINHRGVRLRKAERSLLRLLRQRASK